MTILPLRRRAVLALPLLFAACGDDEPTSFAPLRYDYLPPIQLNVGIVDIETRVVPGLSGNIDNRAPVPPLTALRQMAQDRLRPFGTSGRGVVTIRDASLNLRDDTVTGTMDIVVTIYNMAGERAGFAEAKVLRRYSGRGATSRSRLYELVRAMMDDMNIELEYQIRRNLRSAIHAPSAAPTAVEQAPLAAPGR